MPGKMASSAGYSSSYAFVALLVLLLLAAFGLADPFGPNYIGETPQTFNDNLSPRVIAAQAGNVTMLDINDTSVSRRWQGYYGNLTGKVVLSDAFNNSLYTWDIFPSGEVYASNHSYVDWPKIRCVNFSSNLSDGASFNITQLEPFFGAGKDDKDGIDETFNDTYANATGFLAGSVLIDDQDYCPLTYTYVNNAYQAKEFEEVILTDNSSIIFTTLLEDGQLSFDGRMYDFQMIVPENGDDPSPSQYYFFVELT